MSRHVTGCVPWCRDRLYFDHFVKSIYIAITTCYIMAIDWRCELFEQLFVGPISWKCVSVSRMVAPLLMYTFRTALNKAIFRRCYSMEWTCAIILGVSENEPDVDWVYSQISNSRSELLKTIPYPQSFSFIRANCRTGLLWARELRCWFRACWLLNFRLHSLHIEWIEELRCCYNAK